MQIGELLAFGVKNGSSDLHLSAGEPPMIRVDGDMRRINVPTMEHKDVHDMVYDIMNDKQRKDYEEFLECDFSFEIPKLSMQSAAIITISASAIGLSVPTLSASIWINSLNLPGPGFSFLQTLPV